MTAARHQILARRARFVAAAAAMGVAAAETACAQTCLSTVTACDANPEPRLAVEGPVRLCVGQNADLKLLFLSCDQSNDATNEAAFTSSDPPIVRFDTPRSRTARAVGVGRATITANFADGSGAPTTHVIEVSGCGDAAADADSGD